MTGAFGMKSHLVLLMSVATFCAAAGDPVRTKEAAAVLRNLCAFAQEGRFAYAWCHPWVENAPEFRRETPEGPVPKAASEINLGKGFGRHVDKTPILYFTDFYFVTDETKPPETVARNRASLAGMVRAAWRQYRSVPVFSWHPENPYVPKKWKDKKYGGAPYRYRYSSEGYPQEHRYVFREILAGDAFARGWYDRSIDAIAAFLRELKAEDGTPIPCVVRLFHECEDDWQWWGRNSVSTADYKAVFRLTVETLRAKTGGGAHLLFAYSPDRYWKTVGSSNTPGDFLYRYPGDDVVDIVGHDDYSIGHEGKDEYAEKELAKSILQCQLVSAFAQEHGKAAGLFETGVKGSRDDAYDYIYRVMTAPNVKYGFVCTWGGGYSMPASEAGKACWRRFANRPEVVMYESGKHLVQ